MTKVVKNNYKNTKSANSLDTLAQLPTKTTSLKKRARSKWHTSQVVNHLIYFSQNDKQDEKMRKYFSRAFYCGHRLVQEGKKVRTQYCNSRVCNVCNRIRTAKLIKGYISQLNGRDLYFVTLTIPNVKKTDLEPTIDLMIKNSSNITRVLRERRKTALNGIRKVECTFNMKENTYHPHLHFIVDSKSGADLMIKEWLKRYPNAREKAQNVRRADEKSYIELFKYTTKLSTKSDTKKEGEISGIVKEEREIPTEALYEITKAMYKKRAFQPFGDIKKVAEDIDEMELNSEEHSDLPDYPFMEWEWIGFDWVNIYGECLTNYTPPDLKYIPISIET